MKLVPLGFDCRVASFETNLNLWDPIRREKYLIKQAIDWPFSVDATAWPSAFRFFREHDNTLPQTDDCNDSIYNRMPLNLWRDFDKMCFCLSQHQIALAVVNPILIAVVLDEKIVLPKGAWDILLSARIGHGGTENRWELAGFDVADEYLTSSLSNCGYSKGVADLLRGKWVDRINRRGLIDTVESALEFKWDANQYVASHAPFYVFAVYIVSDTPSASVR